MSKRTYHDRFGQTIKEGDLLMFFRNPGKNGYVNMRTFQVRAPKRLKKIPLVMTRKNDPWEHILFDGNDANGLTVIGNAGTGIDRERINMMYDEAIRRGRANRLALGLPVS